MLVARAVDFNDIGAEITTDARPTFALSLSTTGVRSIDDGRSAQFFNAASSPNASSLPADW